jgi:hypothetical protein
MSELLSNLGKTGKTVGLLSKYADIIDTDFLSKYFVIAEFNPVFTSGKNPVAFNGSSLLKSGSEIQIECLDSNGNSLYIDNVGLKSTQYQDVANFVISVHIYDEAYNGNGKLVLVGTTTKGEIVKWIGNITIDKTLSNASKVRFFNKPTLEVKSLLYPVLKVDVGETLSRKVEFESSFFTIGVNPSQDTNKVNVNQKRNAIDYRLTLTGDDANYGPTMSATKSFNSQMEGQALQINVNKIQLPYSYTEATTNVTQSFKIKEVLDSKTVILSDPFYYLMGSDNIVSNILDGYLTSSYQYIAYNTELDSYETFNPFGGDTTVQVKSSYAEIVYRNLKTYSGFVARHKLYRKSSLQSGDYELIADEPLGASEILMDEITLNKSYSEMGTFYNQSHIDKYWFTSSNDFSLSHQVYPLINSMKIAASSFDAADGNNYVIVKTDSSGSVNDAGYIPFNLEQFTHLSGSSYNSNFINLKKDALYVFSTNIIVEKDKNVDATLSFYFTSSTSTIQREKDYNSQFGLKIAALTVSDSLTNKHFGEKQMFFFTPKEDYYGTLLVVPYKCNVTLSDTSLKIYGDYGFSPDVLFTKIPFKVNMTNETFELKSELFDINSNLIFSDLHTKHTFDRLGESLYSIVPGYNNTDPTTIRGVDGNFTVQENLFLPFIEQCQSDDVRLVGWHYPENSPATDEDGKLCATNIAIVINADNNVVLNSYNENVIENSSRLLIVRYNGAAGEGRRIVLDTNGTKYNYH